MSLPAMYRFHLTPVLLLLFLALAPLQLCAATQSPPMEEAAWRISGEDRKFETYQERSSLYLRNGAAEPIGVEFENGVIEFDIAVPDERGFSGIAFRRLGDGDFEHFYIRPHQSGQPDASQYTPVFHGVAGWQIYYGRRYAAPLEFKFDKWMHVKLVVSGDKADIYLDSEKPVLHVDRLMRDPSRGGIALTASFAGVHFANLSVEEQVSPAIVGEVAPLTPLAKGTVKEWEVSTPFDSASLDGVEPLSPKQLAGLRWTSLAVEENGVANIARLTPFGDRSDAVFARISIDADKQENRRFDFGYSDDVRAYVNGALVYAGSAGYVTRDHRFLGTVGLYDSLFLPLKKGRNEIVFAVKENFGGWAIAGAVDGEN
jgi:hypothetical protein